MTKNIDIIRALRILEGQGIDVTPLGIEPDPTADMEAIVDTINSVQRPVSELIRERIINARGDFHSNHNISKFIQDDEYDLLIDEVSEKFQGVLNSLVIDTKNDHNTNETAKRVAKMYINETFGGRFCPKPKITAFPNASKYDTLYVTGPMEIKSTCAHHFQNIVGKCWIGVSPGADVIGLSKFNRIVNWIAHRPTIQEELTVHIADEIAEITKAKGIAVIVKARHDCMTHRGVRAHESDMTTSVVRGELKENLEMRKEFYTLLSSMNGFGK